MSMRLTPPSPPRWQGITAVILLVALVTYISASAEDCGKILDLGYMNLYTSVSQQDAVASAFRSFCAESYHFASTAKQKQISAARDFLRQTIGSTLKDRLGVNFGSSSLSIEESQSRFCDAGYTNSQYRDFTAVTSLEISARALDSYDRCVALNARGLQTDIRTTDATTVVDVGYTAIGGAEFRGIDQPDLGKAVCKVTSKTLNAVTVTPTLRFPLDTDTATITCSRTFAVKPDGTRYADRTLLTFKTNAGSFDLVLGPQTLRQVSMAELTGIYTFLTSLDRKITDGLKTVSDEAETDFNTLNRPINQVRDALIYHVTAANECAEGWRYLTTVRFLVPRRDIAQTPLVQGPAFDVDWVWTWGSLCHWVGPVK